MELIQYLSANFLTMSELLEATQIDEATFRTMQDDQLIPQASYRLQLNVSCDSFFGAHQEDHQVEFYAKGAVAWVGVVQSGGDAGWVYQTFASRYRTAVDRLKANGYETSAEALNRGLSRHIKDEWAHFLDGTYGLCTRSGLPEDIAAKELAIACINELVESAPLAENKLERLARAVNLLDEVSSAFAPHERLRSSRHRLVDETRRRFGLSERG